MTLNIIEKIEDIKKKRNACILAHNYQSAEIQDIADFTGDSLELSRKAAQTSADVIVFCGVLFMAETASILSPDKTVLLPDKTAGCPMADMITAKQLNELKEKYPNAVVVSYVNSSADVKALSDYCCTSSNAVDVVNSIDKEKKIIFVPDKNLGQVVMEKTGRDLVLWPGYCPTHIFATVEDVKKIIVGTETWIIHKLKLAAPGIEFIPASDSFICPNMKKITLEKVLFSLEDNKYIIKVPQDIAKKARKALDKMVAVLPKG